MRQYRPERCRGRGDKHLLPLSRELEGIVHEAQLGMSYDSLKLGKPAIRKLAEILVEFGEDLHNEIGIWAAYERYNVEFFGATLPFCAPAETAEDLSLNRVRHLLWTVYPELIRGLILSPCHQDLERVATAAHAFLVPAFRAVPHDSGIKTFLDTPNRFGWEVKRKLIWLGTCSYLFRLPCKRYLDEQHRGRRSIGHVDDFLCQECTRWCGLGVIDILAGTLNVSDEDRRTIRGWYERHTSFYRLQAVSDAYLDALNIISDQAYRIRINMPDHPFKPGQIVFGSLVPWRGEWYWSGEQEAWPPKAIQDVPALRDAMKRQDSHILCRFWKEYEAQVRQHAEKLHKASLAFHGTDLVVYPDGLSMAADWQKEMRALWDSKPPEQVRETMRKHNLKKGRPDITLPPDLLEHTDGIGFFLNPDEGQETFTSFHTLVEGLKRGGKDLTPEQEEAVRQFIDSDAVSPAFVRRVVGEYGAESVKASFRLAGDVPDYWLDYLLRSRKGHFYRRRYPTVSVV